MLCTCLWAFFLEVQLAVDAPVRPLEASNSNHRTVLVNDFFFFEYTSMVLNSV